PQDLEVTDHRCRHGGAAVALGGHRPPFCHSRHPPTCRMRVQTFRAGSGRLREKCPRTSYTAPDRRVGIEEELLDWMRLRLREIQRAEALHRGDEGGRI